MWLGQDKAIALNMAQPVPQRSHCTPLVLKNKIQGSGTLNFKPAPKAGAFSLDEK